MRGLAVVTGASSGIGTAFARALSRRGHSLLLVARRRERLEKLAAELGRAEVLTADLGDEAAVVALFDETLARFGDLHILVNNAGLFVGGDFTDLDVAVWDRVQAVNVRGAFLASREAFRRWRALGHGGAIVNMSSLGGVRGTEKFAGFTAYTVSKFALVGLTESLAVEGKPLGIRVNCVAPGAVDTQMKERAAPFLRTQVTADEVARTVRFLCDEEESRALTGAVIEIHSNG